MGGVEEDTLHCWSFAKGCRKRESTLLSSSAVREYRGDGSRRMCVEVGSVSVSIGRERCRGSFSPLALCPSGRLLQRSSARFFVSFFSGTEVVSCGS